MEKIREAIERARASGVIAPPLAAQQQNRAEPRQARLPPIGSRGQDSRLDQAQEFKLNTAHLQSKRIVAHSYMDAQSTAFDMLRTQVLPLMDAKEWRFIGITSPTPGCGKTVTAVNLALSIARLPARSVLLMDLDLRKPQVANCLGLAPRHGVMSTLENRSTLMDAIIPTRIGDYQMMVLPAESRTSGSSDWMASHAMSAMVQQIKDEYRSEIIIADLPPLLSSDDALVVLPRLDCALLVVAAGITTSAEIKQSNHHLQSTELLKVVFNKAPRSRSAYYYY